MVTAQEVHNVTFDKKGLHGYKQDQVDDFLDRVADQLADDEQKITELTQNNEELKDKLLELAQKLEQYHEDEDALKSALLNAQRMGENVIREARQKADALEREARIRSEDILRAGMEKIREQEIEMERIKSEVAQFKASVLGLYKIHIESLSQLPSNERASAPASEPEAAPAPVEEPVAEPEPEVLPEETAEPVDAANEEPTDAAVNEEPAAESAAEDETFWQQDEEELSAEIAAPMSEDSENFRGITFSD